MSGGRAAFLVACALIAGACRSDSDDSGNEEDGGAPTAIDVLVSGDPQELDAYRAVVDAYEQTGDRDVRLTEVTERDELIARLSASIAVGDPPDLFLLNYRYIGQFEAIDAIQPVQPFLNETTAFRSEEFYPQALEAFRTDGVQMCLPQNISSLVVYYNRDLFEDAGVPLPTHDWMWEDMVDRASSLTVDSAGDAASDVYGLGVEPQLIRVAPLIWSEGGELVDDDDDPGRFAFATPAGVLALQALLDVQARGVAPTDEEAESEDLESRFLNGRLAMLIESRKVVPAFRTIEDFRWDVATLPPLKEPANVLHSDAYCMTAASTAQHEAWSFLEFALGPDGQRITAESGRTVPSLVEVAQSDSFLDPARPPASSQVFLDQIPSLRALPHVATWPEIEDLADALIEEAFYESAGGSEASELALQLVAQTKPLFERAAGS